MHLKVLDSIIMGVIYSYDIFDTVLVRTCGNPYVVFDILAKECLHEAEMTQLMDFAFERREGEKRARQAYVRDGREDVTMDQIYSCCDFSMWTDLSKEEIMRRELLIEKDVLVPVKSIQTEIDAHRKDGDKIVFISDMYLSHEFVYQVLKNCALLYDGDSLYVSSSVGLSKEKGGLYEYVKQKEGVAYSSWHHKGDNKHSDFDIPRQLGISASLVTHAPTYYEKLMYGRAYSCQSFDVQSMAAISKAMVLRYGHDPYTLFAADFIAPVFVPYVYSVLQDARRRGIQHLYFLARDGYIFYKIAEQFSSLFPDIELRYLYVSRNSLYLPGIDKVGFDELEHIFQPLKWQKILDILDRLHIPDYDYSSFDFANKDGEQILRTLLDDPHFVDMVNERKREQTELCLRYFEQQGLTRSNSAIVDLRGTRRCHVFINKILAGRNHVFGYYWEVQGNRERGNDYVALNFGERYKDNWNCHFELYDLFEQYFCITSQKRTSGYKEEDGMVIPVFEEERISQEYKEKVSAVNQSVCGEFARHYSRTILTMSGEELSGVAMSVFSDFIVAPDVRYLKALEGLELSESKQRSSKLLVKRGAFESKRETIWYMGNRIYNSFFPCLLTKYYRLRLHISRYFS